MAAAFVVDRGGGGERLKKTSWIGVFLLLLSFGQCSGRCADSCDCLGDSADCSKSGIIRVPHDLPKWVEKLDLSKNEGLQVSEGDFNGLPKLTDLYLGDLGLERLPPLGNLPALKTLVLGGNRLTRVEDVALTGMPQLRELDLSRNRLKVIRAAPFANVTLFRLNLSKNQISRLEEDAFRHQHTLAELKLSRNQLTPETFNRSAPIFTSLINLRSLDLNGNQLHELQGLMFEDLKKLKVLKLRRNQITTFSDGVFYGLDAIENLILDHNNITTVSKGWLFGLDSLQQLSISYNQIDSIRPDAWQPTKRLQSLDMSHNRLVSLREGTFRSLGSLTKLMLSHNHLAHIEQNTFAKTPRLVQLDLSNNQLRWNVEDNSGAFNSLENLQTLSLAYNGIETVHFETFNPLVSLSSLDLRGNQLRTLPSNPFIRLKKLTSVLLNTSSLVCDCHLSWLPGWLSEITFNASSTVASCSYPSILQDRPVTSLRKSDFNCDSSPRPVISQSPKDQIVLHEANVTLACVAQAGTEGDQPRFMWRKNNEVLVNYRPETRVSVVGGDGVGGAVHNVTSLLTLVNVTDEDSGEYQCVVRNQFGASYSQRANIQVHVYPYFTKTPASVTVRIGDVVKLECAAGGSPPPEISLLKDGDDFPAARERRIRVFPSETLFFITPVKPDDDGQYTCKATNAAGTASAHASVTVRQTPEFTKTLQDKVARLGDNAVLECQGTGQPSPKLKWSKDGVPLQDGDHYVLVQNSQYLLILEVQMDDAGTYVCELTNILGTVRGHVNLSIRTEISTTSTTTGIVMMAVVCCVVITSLVWVVIIYQTRKRAQTGPPNGYPREDGLGRYPGHLPAHHIPPDLMHTFTPLLANTQEAYTTATQDSSSEHSSSKDSGTGDSAQRSSEDLLPIDLTRPGLRRSLIVCADSGTSVLRGLSTVSVGPNGELIGCEADPVTRPRLSTFGHQYLSPGSYSPNQYTASLRRSSNARLLPVSSPVTPSTTLTRGHHLYRPDSSQQATPVTPSIDPISIGSGRHLVQPGTPSTDTEDDSNPNKSQNDCSPDPSRSESTDSSGSDSDVHSIRNSKCCPEDGRSELDFRTENSNVNVNNTIIPPKQLKDSR